MDTFSLTLITVVVFTLISAFIRGRTIDRCLKDYRNKHITFENISGKRVWGRFRVETTGFELVYKELRLVREGHCEKSYILYKPEYNTLRYLISYLEDLDEDAQKKRLMVLERTYHPVFIRRVGRKLLNMFRIMRDSLVEIFNLVLGQAKKTTAVGRLSGTQDKYLSKVKDEYISTISNAYEPLLEKYIGHRVVLQIEENDSIKEHCGILKDYSSEFIELIDVDFSTGSEKITRKADLIAPRRIGLIRHLGEK